MQTHRWTAALLCSLGMLLATHPLGARLDVVKTDAGSLSGVSAGGVSAYLGIPFPAPPVGGLRWRPPQPALPWEGVRKADTFGTSCMQNQAGSRLPWTEEFMTQGPIGEDRSSPSTCGPRRTRRMPGCRCCSGSTAAASTKARAPWPSTTGPQLAKKGVIVVTVNYRVGPLGFLAHPELTKESEHGSSGNYGLLDQIAALQLGPQEHRRVWRRPHAGHDLRPVGGRDLGRHT